MTGLRQWFAGRSLRERRMLLVMAALAVITLVWGGVIRPVGDLLSDARQRHNNAVERLGETENALDAIKELRRDRPAPLAGPLDAVIRASANDAGFTLTTLNAQGQDRAQIAITTAKPAAMFQWIARLEGAGIIVDTANVTDNGDRTVGVQMTLKARGR